MVSYENIVSNGIESELKKICDYLDIDFSNTFKCPSVLGKKGIVMTSSRKSEKVFNPHESSWTKDLTIIQIVLIGVSSFLYRLLRKLISAR